MYWDIKPQPRTELGVLDAFLNDQVSKVVSQSIFNKKINVDQHHSKFTFAYLDYGNGKKGFAVF